MPDLHRFLNTSTAQLFRMGFPILESRIFLVRREETLVGLQILVRSSQSVSNHEIKKTYTWIRAAAPLSVLHATASVSIRTGRLIVAFYVGHFGPNPFRLDRFQERKACCHSRKTFASRRVAGGAVRTAVNAVRAAHSLKVRDHV